MTVVHSIFAGLAAWLLGSIAGSLLLAPRHTRTDLPLAILRTLVGLMLASIALLLALVLSLPRFTLVAALVGLALVRHGRTALGLVSLRWRVSPGDAVAILVSIVMLAPPLVSSLLMAPGSFPPLFLNVDMPYFLEKVHAVMTADAFPPPSLSVAGGSRPYHFGLHAVVALVSGASGLAPHHVLFGLLIPFLLSCIVAAAISLSRVLAPSVPSVLTVSLLLVPAPTLWYDFWRDALPRLTDAVRRVSLEPALALTTNWEMWGAAPNVQNTGAYALALALVAAIVRAPTIGWSLAAFLAGSAFLFKSPAGVAFMAGFGLLQLARVVADRSLKPLVPLAAASAVFLAIYGTFWFFVPAAGELRASFTPFFHLEYLDGHGGRGWFGLDLLWLVLPAVAVLLVAPRGTMRDSLLLLVLAWGPLVAVNLIRLVDMRRNYGISSMNEDDWRQVIMPVPLLLHTVVVATIGSRWPQMRSVSRAAIAATVALSVAPMIFVAVRYTSVLVSTPQRGHEYADNQAIGAALSTIPVRGSIVVTNDLRYPANTFARDRRQMQIPALFGHQAFAVNYFYEAYEFSRERAGLQMLLEQDTWSPELDEAASRHGWTHLLIRHDYPHPADIPLTRTFDNGTYAVYRFDQHDAPTP